MPSDLERRQDIGGPFQGEGTHKTATGATAAAIKRDMVAGPDPADLGEPLRNTQEPITKDVNGVGNGPQVRSTSDAVEVLCGPLINYRRMSGEQTDHPIWHGSVLIVAAPGNIPPNLQLRCASRSAEEQNFKATKLYEDPKSAFWQWSISAPILDTESEWIYTIPTLVKPKTGESLSDKPCRFFIPSRHESMRIMFHSCNGFSVGTDVDAWSGPALWNDVLRVHSEKPFHVMIGGGDQIYNDGVRVDGPLRPWTDIANPKKRRDYPFPEKMRQECDEYYFDNYVRWYGHEPFATANAQIPQVNIWDDHDIIDGFGSYTDHFMRCAVFRGIGGVAHKYYMLFQHHLPPPISTFTTDAPQTTKAGGENGDGVQLRDTWVAKLDRLDDESYIIGKKLGPYVEECSRNIYCQLGAHIAFMGIDARTERTRHQINYPETYEQLFNHTGTKIAASNGAIKHLILLLGVPIAYPRLQWLENILQSPIIGPIRFLNKRFGIAGGFFNQFDGNVDLLDDLDDHYTAHQHKKERKYLVERLQTIAKEYNVRVTILGGDVHLAALGRFYSSPKLAIPAERDWRYMPNIISSAITNKPPPQAVANLLAKRNKVHHLDPETDETLLELFDENPGAGQEGVKPKTSDSNHATMPSRNYAIITESHAYAPTNGVNGYANGVNGEAGQGFQLPKNPREPLHLGEKDAGTKHPAAGGIERSGLAGPDGLDVTIKVEISSGDPSGKTQGYGFSVPGLDCRGYKGQGEKW